MGSTATNSAGSLRVLGVPFCQSEGHHSALCPLCVTIAAHALRRPLRRANGTNGAAVCFCSSFVCPRLPSLDPFLVLQSAPDGERALPTYKPGLSLYADLVSHTLASSVDGRRPLACRLLFAPPAFCCSVQFSIFCICRSCAANACVCVSAVLGHAMQSLL